MVSDLRGRRLDGSGPTVPDVIGDADQGWFGAGKLRRLVPLFALAVAVVAWVTEPSATSDLVLVALPVAAFFVWAYVPRVPLSVLTIVVVVPAARMPEPIQSM